VNILLLSANMRIPGFALLIALLYVASSQAADTKAPKGVQPCTITSPTSGSFYDLNTIAVLPLIDGRKVHKDDRNESWHARGYDYGANFTLNFCAPVIEKLDDVEGVQEKLWRNVSAYYTKGKMTYSMGYVIHQTAPTANGSRFGIRALSV